MKFLMELKSGIPVFPFNTVDVVFDGVEIGDSGISPTYSPRNIGTLYGQLQENGTTREEDIYEGRLHNSLYRHWLYLDLNIVMLFFFVSQSTASLDSSACKT